MSAYEYKYFKTVENPQSNGSLERMDAALFDIRQREGVIYAALIEFLASMRMLTASTRDDMHRQALAKISARLTSAVVLDHGFNQDRVMRDSEIVTMKALELDEQ